MQCYGGILLARENGWDTGTKHGPPFVAQKDAKMLAEIKAILAH